jgi:pyruvate/2-oxoglutarate dehydrogenase complex dihydrolipoamide dehydrogenase (E3) component
MPLEKTAGEFISPLDEHNKALLANVRPGSWANPEPQGRYNLVVLGAGTAGLITAAAAAGLGAKVALIEKNLMGGDCLNVGCVPSKALLRAARAVAAARKASEFGVQVSGEKIQADFTAAMTRLRRLRARISANDSAQRYKSLGVDVFLGQGRFLGPHGIDVGGKTLHFSKAVIATGGRAADLPIPGLKEAGYHTNETLFNLTELPKRIAVIGAGPIGCEMAQALARFGAQVTLLEVAEQILIREDQDAAKIVEAALRADGVEILTGCKIQGIEKNGDEKTFSLMRGEEKSRLLVDAIIVGVGRAPNVQGLGLEKAGVTYDERAGVTVDDFLRTSNSDIYAAGDICLGPKFTHTADASARIVVQNALFLGRKRFSALTIPWCTYTEPEIAHVGLYEQEAATQGYAVKTFLQKMEDVDRAVLDGETEGFVKILTEEGTDRILGATIVASHAGDMISEISVAMNNKVGLAGIGATIHPYPTQAEAVRRLGDAYQRTRLTPFLKSLLAGWLKLRR